MIRRKKKNPEFDYRKNIKNIIARGLNQAIIELNMAIGDITEYRNYEWWKYLTDEENEELENIQQNLEKLQKKFSK